MDGIRFVREQYLTLRDGLTTWLPRHLSGKAWYYRPTPQSTSAAWIVPHLVAFEHVSIWTKLRGWTFPPAATPDFVERYRGGAAGHEMRDDELATMEQALAFLARAREVSSAFLEALAGAEPTTKSVDREDAFQRYLANFAHDTEHLGQLKYLAGTYERLAKGA